MFKSKTPAFRAAKTLISGAEAGPAFSPEAGPTQVFVAGPFGSGVSVRPAGFRSGLPSALLPCRAAPALLLRACGAARGGAVAGCLLLRDPIV